MKGQIRTGWPSSKDVGMRHRLHILGSNPTGLKCGAYLICVLRVGSYIQGLPSNLVLDESLGHCGSSLPKKKRKERQRMFSFFIF